MEWGDPQSRTPFLGPGAVDPEGNLFDINAFLGVSNIIFNEDFYLVLSGYDQLNHTLPASVGGNSHQETARNTSQPMKLGQTVTSKIDSNVNYGVHIQSHSQYPMGGDQSMPEQQGPFQSITEDNDYSGVQQNSFPPFASTSRGSKGFGSGSGLPYNANQGAQPSKHPLQNGIQEDYLAGEIHCNSQSGPANLLRQLNDKVDTQTASLASAPGLSRLGAGIVQQDVQDGEMNIPNGTNVPQFGFALPLTFNGTEYNIQRSAVSYPTSALNNVFYDPVLPDVTSDGDTAQISKFQNFVHKKTENPKKRAYKDEADEKYPDTNIDTFGSASGPSEPCRKRSRHQSISEDDALANIPFLYG